LSHLESTKWLTRVQPGIFLLWTRMAFLHCLLTYARKVVISCIIFCVVVCNIKWSHCLSAVHVLLFDSILFCFVFFSSSLLAGFFTPQIYPEEECFGTVYGWLLKFLLWFRGTSVWAMPSSFPFLCVYVNVNRSILILVTCLLINLLLTFFFSCFSPFYYFPFRVLRGEEMHIELLFKHVLLIWAIYIWRLRFASCCSWNMCR